MLSIKRAVDTLPGCSRGTIPDAMRPWASLLVARHLRQDLRSAVAKLTDKEARYVHTFILGSDAPLNVLLDGWELPRLEGDGFWKGEVLPILERRLNPQLSRSFGDGTALRDRFQRVKAAVDIVDIAGRFTTLKGSGRLRKGRCPFHEENTPSFTVYSVEQRWRCYGACGRGGDVVELVRLLMEVGRW